MAIECVAANATWDAAVPLPAATSWPAVMSRLVDSACTRRAAAAAFVQHRSRTFQGSGVRGMLPRLVQIRSVLTKKCSHAARRASQEDARKMLARGEGQKVGKSSRCMISGRGAPNPTNNWQRLAKVGPNRANVAQGLQPDHHFFKNMSACAPSTHKARSQHVRLCTHRMASKLTLSSGQPRPPPFARKWRSSPTSAHRCCPRRPRASGLPDIPNISTPVPSFGRLC